MEIILFFLLFFSSIFLAYYYYAHKVIYLGVLAGIIIIFLGINLAATGNFESLSCFSNKVNETTINANLTQYDYTTSCHLETLSISRDFINAMGGIMMLIGAGMVIDFISTLRKDRGKDI